MIILFKDDWTDSQGRQIAVPHIETNNWSFKRISMILKSMGIENNLFMLSLTQPELAKYNPHKLTDNSLELKTMIAHEAQINPWYFLREIVRIPVPGGNGVPYEAHRGNVSMAWCFFAGINYISIMPRQTGKTISKLVLDTWVLYLHGFNITHGLVTKDSQLRQENVARIKALRDLLPPWLVHHRSDDTDNKEGLIYKSLQNKYITHVGLSDRNKARNIGRGNTYATLHFDEAPFISNIDVIHPSILPAQSTGGRIAKENGMVHANVYTTTAGSLSTKSGHYAYDLVCNAMTFTEKIYDTETIEDAKSMLNLNSTNQLMNGTFSYLQLGKSHEWFIEQTQKLGASDSDIDRDFLNIWKSDTDFSILTKDMIKQMKSYQREPVYLEIVSDNYVFNWYITQQEVESGYYKNKSLILAMDSSENIGRDFTALVLLDPTTMKVIATFRCNESNIIRLAVTIGNFLVMYTKTIFIPERKSTGPAIIDQIILILKKNGINPFTKIYNKVVQENMDININDVNLSETNSKRFLGFQTTGQSRAYLYKNVLNKATRLNYARIFDATIINELTGLSVINGRVDHGDHAHDDMAISYLLACWLVYEGKNLERYGLETNLFLIDDYTEDKQSDIKQQVDLVNKIEHFEALMRNTNSDIMKEHFKRKIDSLKQYVKNDLTIEPIARDHVMKAYGSYYRDPRIEEAQPVTSEYISKVMQAVS